MPGDTYYTSLLIGLRATNSPHREIRGHVHALMTSRKGANPLLERVDDAVTYVDSVERDNR
jgi:hypothetical protein